MIGIAYVRSTLLSPSSRRKYAIAATMMAMKATLAARPSRNEMNPKAVTAFQKIPTSATTRIDKPVCMMIAT